VRNFSPYELQTRRSARRDSREPAIVSQLRGTDFETFTGYDWDALDRATDRVRGRAAELGIWVVTGSAHRFSDVHPFM
jgi:hypothetical protein